MIKKILSSKTSRQTIFLFLAQIFGMGISFISNMILAKQMGSQIFGIYSFSLAIISFSSIFFEFGYFSSVSRLLAVNNSIDREKELIGASIIIAIAIFVCFFLFVFIISFILDLLLKDEIGYILRLASVVSWSFIVPFYMELIFKGTNNIEFLAEFNVAWKLLFMLFLIFLYISKALSPTNTLIVLSVSAIIPFCFFINKLNPSFANLKLNLSIIKNENRVFGKHIYTGRIIDVSTYNLDRLLIGLLNGSKEVGFYSLANSMSNPINSFSIALTSSLFKSFSKQSTISKKILYWNFCTVLIMLFMVNLIGYIVINYYLKEEYNSIFYLLLIMSFAVCFQASYQPYNLWLYGHSKGKELKYMSLSMGAINLIGNIFLIPSFGAIGAAFSSLIGTATYYFLSVYSYHKAIN